MKLILKLFLGNWNTSKYKVTELFKASVVVMELGMLERATSIMGGVCIFDLGGVGLSHVWNITPAVAETVVDLLVVRALSHHHQSFSSYWYYTLCRVCFLLHPWTAGYAYWQRPRRAQKTFTVNIPAPRRQSCYLSYGMGDFSLTGWDKSLWVVYDSNTEILVYEWENSAPFKAYIIQTSNSSCKK